MIEYVNHGGKVIAVVSGSPVGAAADMLDIMAEVFFGGCDSMIIKSELLPENFFSLKSGIAGEILQKFSNYKMKLAITGDFSNITSKALADFIFESNKGNQVFFKSTMEEAMDSLSKS